MKPDGDEEFQQAIEIARDLTPTRAIIPRSVEIEEGACG